MEEPKFTDTAVPYHLATVNCLCQNDQGTHSVHMSRSSVPGRLCGRQRLPLHLSVVELCPKVRCLPIVAKPGFQFYKGYKNPREMLDPNAVD